jgi:hypothetical protein
MAESSERALTPDEATHVTSARDNAPVCNEGVRIVAVDLARPKP